MAGRHQSQYTRYASSNQSYPAANHGNSLGIPHPYSNNASHHAGIGGYTSTSSSAYSTATPNMTSPYSTTSSPGYNSPNVPKQGSQPAQLKKYTLQPPPRQLPLSKSMPSLGYPDIYPQRPNQDEDTLTPSNVRNGFADKAAVSNEHTSAHDMVYSKLQEDQRILNELGGFAVEVLKRKRNAAKIAGPSTFKAPTRHTITEAKRDMWMQDLANGMVPLRKLARNAPHGFKNDKLLDTLAAKQVPFIRAIWFIKIVGLYEMSHPDRGAAATGGNQGKPPYPVLWTQKIFHYFHKIIKELAPSESTSSSTVPNRNYRPHPGTPSNSHDSRPWSTPEYRARFEQRWSYSTRLARWMYNEGLLDQRIFLKYSLDMLATCASFETIWLVLTFLIQDYIDEYKRNRTLTKLLVETLVKVYGALVQHLLHWSHNIYGDIQRYIERLLQSLLLSVPDAFFNPKVYLQYRHVLENIFTKDLGASEIIPDIYQTMQRHWEMIKARNKIFCPNADDTRLELDLPDHTAYQSTVNEDRVIRILDNIGKHVDSCNGLLIDEHGWMDVRGNTALSTANAIFEDSLATRDNEMQIIAVICRWATSECRHGDWRPYMVSSILKQWVDLKPARKDTLQDALISWLDSQVDSELAAQGDVCPENHVNESASVVLLFDTLIRLRLFSYQKYLLRLIARGDLEPKTRQCPRTMRCLEYLASFPLPTPSAPSLNNQRHVAIYGSRKDSVSHGEIETLTQLKQLARYLVTGSTSQEDNLFSQEAKNMTQPDLNDTILPASAKVEQDLVDVMRSSLRYVILKFTTEWLVPETKAFVVENVPIGEDNWRVMTLPGSSLLNARQYVAIITILEHAKDYLSVIDIATWVLEKTNERSLFNLTIETFRRHASTWKLVDQGAKVAKAVWAKHHALASRGTRERCLMMYLVELVKEGYPLSEEMRVQLQQDLHYQPKIRNRKRATPSNELLLIMQNPSAENVQNIADSLCPVSSCAPLLDAAFETLQRHAQEKQIAVVATGIGNQGLPEFRQKICAVCDLIKLVADQATLSGQLDQVVSQWLSLSSHEILKEMYKAESWFPFFLATMAARRLVGIDILLQQFVLSWFAHIDQEVLLHTEPQWTEPTQETECLGYLAKNLVTLVRMLVIQNQPDENSAWVLPNEEIFRLQVQRQPQLASSLERMTALFDLVRHSISIASHLPLSSFIIQDLSMLQADLLRLGWFRRACVRDVNTIYHHFATTTEGEVRKRMFAVIDDLIGANMNIQRDMVSGVIPAFNERLHAIFSDLSQWNENQCQVQLNLLLDSIATSSDGNMDAMILDSSPAPAPSGEHSRDLDLFVSFFFDAVLSTPTQSPNARRRFDFMLNLIQGLSEPVLLALLNHGVAILESNEDEFPGNIHLVQPFANESYPQQCQAFFLVMRLLLAKGVWDENKKIEFVKMLYRQLEKFASGATVYKLMAAVENVSYSEACKALQTAKSNLMSAITALKTEGVPQDVSDLDAANGPRIMLQDIRISLLFRLRLLVPFVSLIWEHPKQEQCDILNWIKRLMTLLSNPIVHGNGNQEEFFDFILDLVSLLIDEVPKDLRKDILAYLTPMHFELESVPAVLQCRIKRILPFISFNIYLSNTRISSSILGSSTTTDPLQQHQHLETCMEQAKPWEWLEDIVSEPPQENDAPISLSIFNGRKSKRTDSNHMRWNLKTI